MDLIDRIDTVCDLLGAEGDTGAWDIRAQSHMIRADGELGEEERHRFLQEQYAQAKGSLEWLEGYLIVEDALSLAIYRQVAGDGMADR